MARRKVRFRVIAVDRPGYTGRTPMFDSPEEAMEYAGQFMRGNRPMSAAAWMSRDAKPYVLVEESHPTGDHYALAKWVGKNGAWELEMRREPVRSAPAKKNPAGQLPKAQIEFFVGKLNVGEPDSVVAAEIRKRCQGWPAKEIVRAEKYAITVHHRNQKLYAAVSSGPRWR